MPQGLPIVFMHYGCSPYLPFTVGRAKMLNLNSPVLLIGDAENERMLPFVQHANMNRYAKQAAAFEKIYRHHSPNGLGYELFCFLRWFILRDFMITNRLTEIIHLDGHGGCTKWGGDVTSLLARVAETRAEDERREAARVARVARPVAPPRERVVKPRRLSSQEERELAALPAQIEAAEALVDSLTARLSDPALYSGPIADRERVEAERSAGVVEQERLFARWEELEARKEASAEKP